MKIIAPWREWSIKSRDEEIDYAEAHNIPLKITRETSYSKDKNLWHLSHEGLDLEDPNNEPKYDEILELGVSPEKAPDKPTYVTISFEKGIPVAIDGEKMGAVEIVEKLNKLGGENGVGIVDMVENRLVGMKSRGVYETPAARSSTTRTTSSRSSASTETPITTSSRSRSVSRSWYTSASGSARCARRSPRSWTAPSRTVTGDVKLKLYKGNIIDAGTTSPYSLYDEEIATFGEEEVYNQADSAGFINLFGLPTKVQAKKKGY